MIDPQAIDVAAGQQLEHQAVTFREDLGRLHADGRQLVDVEEAAVIDLIVGGLPVREAIDLGVQQLVEVVVTVRVSGRPVEFQHAAANVRGDGRGAFHQRAEPALYHLFLPLSLRHGGGLSDGAFGQMLEGGDDALQFAQLLGVGRRGLLQRVQAVRQNVFVASRFDGQKRLVVPQEERPVPVFEFQFPRFENLAVLAAEDGQEDSILQFIFDGPPVDVEESGMGRSGAVLQHVVPPQVFGGRRAHVVRHRVEDLAHRVVVQGFDHRPIVVRVAQAGIQLPVIDDGVAVRASRADLLAGRGIEMAHAEIGQVGDDASRIAERHPFALELNAVGRRGAAETIAGRLRNRLSNPLCPGTDIVAHGRPPLALKINNS